MVKESMSLSAFIMRSLLSLCLKLDCFGAPCIFLVSQFVL
uniref:Uncharacterized protein n=1 Tax=Arundo donax TaxID=35708 RepID=A0A0A8YWC5_ARUDO